VSDCSVLEFALLADGVKLDQLYPLDIDRALRSLDRLGRDNIIWHSTNQEQVQQLTSGAVSLATAFDGRLIAANRSGGQIGFTADYSAVSGNPYCVIAKSERKAEAFQLLDYMLTNVGADAELMKLTNYAVPNTKALALVPQSVLDMLPTRPAEHVACGLEQPAHCRIVGQHKCRQQFRHGACSTPFGAGKEFDAQLPLRQD
jgi:putative spermidine/putrescine transport system substrate-binding protein